jgi:hypothetical protein
VVEAMRRRVGTGDCVVDERKRSETERLGREMARPILFDGRPWARVRRSLDSCTMRAWFAVAKG